MKEDLAARRNLAMKAEASQNNVEHMRSERCDRSRSKLVAQEMDDNCHAKRRKITLTPMAGRCRSADEAETKNANDMNKHKRINI